MIRSGRFSPLPFFKRATTLGPFGSSSPWQKSALFAVSIVGAVCDRAFFVELTKCGRSQTAPTVGNPSLRLLPRAARIQRISVYRLPDDGLNASSLKYDHPHL